MAKLTHVDARGRAQMVDVGEKPTTRREAVAAGEVRMTADTLRLVAAGRIPKGDVLAVARLAGIMAAKRTADLIPLCHPLSIASVQIDFEPREPEGVLAIESRVKADGKTGVEMEALTAVSAAALAVYDMCKAADRAMTISNIRLMKKTGGKSGSYTRHEPSR